MAAAAPTPPAVGSVTFDQASYTPGQAIHVTVDYTPGMSPATHQFTVNATDSASGETGELVVGFVTMASDTTTVTAADTGNRVWTKVSDTGTVAVFTATA